MVVLINGFSIILYRFLLGFDLFFTNLIMLLKIYEKKRKKIHSQQFEKRLLIPFL